MQHLLHSQIVKSGFSVTGSEWEQEKEHVQTRKAPPPPTGLVMIGFLFVSVFPIEWEGAASVTVDNTMLRATFCGCTGLLEVVYFLHPPLVGPR